MKMAREFGSKSYKPEEVRFEATGRQDSGLPWSAVQRMLPKNILDKGFPLLVSHYIMTFFILLEVCQLNAEVFLPQFSSVSIICKYLRIVNLGFCKLFVCSLFSNHIIFSAQETKAGKRHQ